MFELLEGAAARPHLTLDSHPCFNHEARLTHARVHLPVAPECNMQCRYCDRKFNCVNESRPGVTCMVLTPREALDYLMEMEKRTDNLSVVGIAGPGDPFANPEETLETLRLVRVEYPKMMLCLATNGLNLLPYVSELSALGVSHVTITVNTTKPETGAKIYSWIASGGVRLKGAEAARLLWERQKLSIMALRSCGILVKINTILIPNINESQIVDIAETVAGLGANILNIIPLHPTPNTEFASLPEPGAARITALRAQAGKSLPQMTHCMRCRADAAGLLNAPLDAARLRAIKEESEAAGLKSCASAESRPDSAHWSKTRRIRQTPREIENLEISAVRPYVAVASMDGLFVNQHLGQADRLRIYKPGIGRPEMVDFRATPPPAKGVGRWRDLAKVLKDCGRLLVGGIGYGPHVILANRDIKVHIIEGSIKEALELVASGGDLDTMVKPEAETCCKPCRSGGMCGWA